MSDTDHSDVNDEPGQHFIPLPPDEPFFGGLSSFWKTGIRTAEFGLAFACAAAAWTVGGDTVLRVIALIVGWVLASLGFASVTNRTGRGLAIVGCFLVFAGEGGFLTWHFLPIPNDSTVENSSAKPALDDTIQLICEWSQPPTVVPRHKLFELELNSALTDGGAWVSFSQQEGTPISLVNPDTPDYFVRCRFNNLGQFSLVNVSTELTVDFREVEQLPTGSRSGKSVASHVITTPRVTLGAGQTFDLYVRNYSPFWVSLSWRSSASGQLVGSDRSTNFRLITGQASVIGMHPFNPKPNLTASAESAQSASAGAQAAASSPLPASPVVASSPAVSFAKNPSNLQAVPPSVVPKPPPIPRPRPSSVAANENVEKDGKQGRTLIGYNASELTQIFGAGQKLDVFVNKWMKVEGAISSVPFADRFGGKEFYAVGVADGAATVAAYFDAKKFGDVLLSMKMGQGIGAVCQFAGVQKVQEDGSPARNVVIATYCEPPNTTP